MPDIITHYRFGDRVFGLLDQNVRGVICRGVYDHTTIGPDIWFSYRFYLPKKQRGIPARGSYMHRHGTGDFFRALADVARDSDARDEVFSYMAGYMCHLYLDSTAHPYIMCRTGDYDCTPETMEYRGNHMLLERAIDHRMLKKWGRSMWSSPVLRNVLYLKKLPESIHGALDSVYKKVFGWDEAFNDLNAGLRDQRIFYFLMQDPTGLMDRLARALDNGRSKNDFRAVSYFGKEQKNLDVLNDAHAQWRHPFDTSVVSEESFDDMFERAAEKAARMIEKAWRYVSGESQEADGCLPADISYETGFECEDPRNLNIPVFDTFNFRRK